MGMAVEQRDAIREPVAPRFGVNAPRSSVAPVEPMKPFRFVVSWTSLTATLSLREARAMDAAPANRTVLPAVMVPLPVPPRETPAASSARWEMVVPKMVRVNGAPRALPAEAPHDRHADHPMFASSEAPFLSRAFSSMGRRTKALLMAPAQTMEVIPPPPSHTNGRPSRLQILQLNDPIPPVETAGAEDRYAVRELLLSKIARTLRGRTPASASEEPVERTRL